MALKRSRNLHTGVAMLVMAAGSLAGCGNKGDLYLVPDQITDQEIQELDRVLSVEDIPAAEPAEARTTAAENFIFEILERDNYKVGYL
jgi:predicted small lipoprotein YifL